MYIFCGMRNGHSVFSVSVPKSWEENCLRYVWTVFFVFSLGRSIAPKAAFDQPHVKFDSLFPYSGTLYYYCDLAHPQEFQPMPAQLSMKAALPLAKILATASCRSSNIGHWFSAAMPLQNECMEAQITYYRCLLTYNQHDIITDTTTVTLFLKSFACAIIWYKIQNFIYWWEITLAQQWYTNHVRSFLLVYHFWSLQ